MQIITLELDNFDFFCPVTGEQIMGEEVPFNEDAKSLLGFWHTEIIEEPIIKDSKLAKAWESFLAKFYEDDEDAFLTTDEVEDFLQNYEFDNAVVFCRIVKGFACGPVYDVSYTVLNLGI